jgi:shikimate dehydrogenase
LTGRPLGTTQVAAVIGDPVRHSLSPVLHNAAFEAMGVDWVYVAFPVPAGAGRAAVEAMRTFGVSGLSVTMPHKADVAAAVDRLTPTAERLGVANTVLSSGEDLIGDSTDGPGFVDALREDEGWVPDGRRCVVLGSGGAARAVCLALADAGAAGVVVVSRRRGPAAECAALAGTVGKVGTVAEVADADLVVNATPVGMVGHGPTPITHVHGQPDEEALPFDLDPGRLGAGQLVVDLIYAPPITPLLRVARAQGAAATNGLGMLVHQAGRQIRAWTGSEPPLEVMSAAMLAAGPFSPASGD